MKKIELFQKTIIDKIQMKCSRYFLHPNIVRFNILGNLIVIEIPSYYTYTEYIFFRGSKKNELNILLDIEQYLEKGIKTVFTKNIEITDDDYIKSIEEYDGMMDIDDY